MPSYMRCICDDFSCLFTVLLVCVQVLLIISGIGVACIYIRVRRKSRFFPNIFLLDVEFFCLPSKLEKFILAEQKSCKFSIIFPVQELKKELSKVKKKEDFEVTELL